MTNFNTYIDQIVREGGREKGALLSHLQRIQKEFNYLPEDALKYLGEITDISEADIIGTATFYSQFRFRPAGKHRLKVCTGTACHVKGAEMVYDSLKRTLRIAPDQDTDQEKKFTIEKIGCLGCCTLAPVVQIDETTYGHVTPASAGNVISDFSERTTPDTSQRMPGHSKTPYQGEIRIGLGSCCIASGSEDIRQNVEKCLEKHAINARIKHVGCVGMCHQVPLAELIPVNGSPRLYAQLAKEDVDRVILKHFKPAGKLRRLTRKFIHMIENIQDDQHWEGVSRYSLNIRDPQVEAFLGKQQPIATEHRGIIDPVDLDEYIRRGGFEGLKKALSMTPEAVISEVKSSGMRGRGGAGFPTGLKWEAVAARPSEEKYLICNGDEGDPGAFMDRMLLESYPFRIIEGMLIAAHATGAGEALLYIRAEYPLAVLRIQQALEMCEKRGLTGTNILDSGLTCRLSVREGAGAFVCGEESALIASLEGGRGFPRKRPPYPAEKGLSGKPTLINNTETFAQIPYILQYGHKAFASTGSDSSKGSKVFALAGKVNRGGLIEVPMGITIREIVEDIGGGVQDGKTLKAVQVGGPSGGCVPRSLADKTIDFESLEEVGAMMGSGGLVVLDEDDCMVDMARYFLAFTQEESCGKCTFCRAGTRRMLDIMEMLCEGKGTPALLQELETLAGWTARGSLCGLGKTAPNPVMSTLRYFRQEYEAHLRGQCPTGTCKDLVRYHIGDDCIGCTICAQNCPEEAIPFHPHNKHEIDTELCTKCDICKQACPAGAVQVLSP